MCNCSIIRAVLASWLVSVLFSPLAAEMKSPAILVELHDVIGPASQDWVTRSLESAEQAGAPLVILRMDTPGGLDFSMRKIIASILDANIPIVTWVAPAGARAASAGTYILLASPVAAMAPTTHLGAATPVRIGGIPDLPDSRSADEKTVANDPMQHKMINDAAAYIRGLAERHGRNAQWAEYAVREAGTLTAREALQKNVIDLIAADIPELLQKIDGRKVSLGHVDTVLHTQGLPVRVVEPDWRNRLLSMIADPNVAYILLLIGIYGLVFEFSSPGHIVPGIAGAIALLLAAYAFQVLPVSFTGLALLVVGLVFIVAEAFVTSGGALGIGGLIAFVLGSIILFDDENIAVSLPLVGGMALAAGGFLLWMVGELVLLRRKRAVTGAEGMLSEVGTVQRRFSHRGWVRVHGESWRAESDRPLVKGQKVRVVDINGLVLKVEAIEES